MDRKLSVLVLSLLIVSLTVPVLGTSQTEDSPFSEETLWTRQYDENKSVFTYPTPDGDFLIYNGTNIDLVDDEGELIWTKDLEHQSKGLPTFKNDKMYLFTDPEGEDHHYLNCLNKENGTKLWDMRVDSWGFRILVNDDGEIFIPHIWNSNITKISSDREVLWDKGFTDSEHLMNTFMIDDRLYFSTGYPDSKAVCISSDGKIEWELFMEEESVTLRRGFGNDDELYAYTSESIYKVTKDGKKDKIYGCEEGIRLKSVMYNENRYYFTAEQKEGNWTYLKSISDDGEELWNNSLESTEEGGVYLRMHMGGNERIYCAYMDHRDQTTRTQEIKSYESTGELAWEHEFENGTAHKRHFITEDGVIVTSTEDGRVMAYQGKGLEEDEDRPNIYLYVLILVAIVAVTISVFYLRKG